MGHITHRWTHGLGWVQKNVSGLGWVGSRQVTNGSGWVGSKLLDPLTTLVPIQLTVLLRVHLQNLAIYLPTNNLVTFLQKFTYYFRFL